MDIALGIARVLLLIAGVVMFIAAMAASEGPSEDVKRRFPRSFAEYRQMHTPVQFRRTMWGTACFAGAMVATAVQRWVV